jgi:hypothetical protein
MGLFERLIGNPEPPPDAGVDLHLLKIRLGTTKRQQTHGIHYVLARNLRENFTAMSNRLSVLPCRGAHAQTLMLYRTACGKLWKAGWTR